MYVYTVAFVAAYTLLEAAQETDTTGQAVGSLDAASAITQTLGQSRLTGFLAGAPGLIVDFGDCVSGRN